MHRVYAAAGDHKSCKNFLEIILYAVVAERRYWAIVRRGQQRRGTKEK
jgi:hypothetical protein